MKCTVCNERNGNTRCEGCNTLFCLPCMTQHHDELAQQFQLLMDVRNEIKQSLDIPRSTSSDGKEVSCLIEIDKWERETIQRIEEIAANARKNVNELIMKHLNEISDRFEQISVQMQQQQKAGDYLENDVERVKNQLDELKNDIKHVNEKIRVDSTVSNNIEWDTFIYVIEEELPSKTACESMQTENGVTKEKVNDSSTTTFSAEQSTTKTPDSSSIPVHIVQSNPSSNDVHPKTHRSESCLFHDSSFTGVCSRCDQKGRIPTSSRSLSLRSQTQDRCAPAHDRNCTTLSSRAPITKSSAMLCCPYCKYPNLVNNLISHSGYRCALCHNFMRVTLY